MWKAKTVVLIVAVSVLPFTEFVDAGGNGWGVWTNSERTHVYAFLKNNELKFWGQRTTWDADLKRHTHTQAKTDGVWHSQAGMCWLGDQKQQQGNVMIYVDSLQCCMSAIFLGKKLVLSEVWKKGIDEYGVCQNRVLTNSTMPSD